MDWLVGKFGFDEHLWRKLEPRQQSWLFLSSALVLLSCALFALSGGYVAYISATGHKNQWLVALFIFAITFVLAFNFRRLFVLMGGYPLQQSPVDVESWQPTRVRLALIVVMALFFSQPLALLVSQSSYKNALKDRIELKVNYFELSKQSELKSRIDDQTLALARFKDGLSRLPMVASDASTKVVAKTDLRNNRKALLIGGASYRNYDPLKNVPNDIKGMKQMLQGLGFEVVESLDERRDLILGKLINHIRNLNAGDLSLIYYAGHGLQFRGRNYIIPFDFPMPLSVQALRTYGIDANDYVEKIDGQTPRFNLVMLDACREFIGSTEQGLAKIETENARNTIIMLAASPGKLASDGAGKNSPFTDAVLKNFPKSEDFSKVVSYVTRDVSEATHGAQKPVSTVSLIDVDFQLAQPISAKVADIPRKDTTEEPVADVCHAGNVAARQECYVANIRLIEERKKALEKSLIENIPLKVNAYRHEINASGVLTDRWQLFWQSKFLAIALSLVMVFVLVSGDFMRDVIWLTPLREYEKFRHEEGRQFVKAKFDDMEAKAQNSLLAQGIQPNRILERWDYASNFYRAEEKVMAQEKLHIVNDQASWAELVDKLQANVSGGQS